MQNNFTNDKTMKLAHMFVSLCESAISMAGVVIILSQTTLRQLLQVLYQTLTLPPYISPWKGFTGL